MPQESGGLWARDVGEGEIAIQREGENARPAGGLPQSGVELAGEGLDEENGHSS